MQLPNNTSLKKGKYQVVRCIGQGGYGITYLATTTEEMKGSLGAFPVRVPVAVKEFFVKTYSTRDDLTLDVVVHTEEGKALVPQLRKDFLREARCMAKMKHPNIVKVIDVFEEHQTAYYVMQYLEGGSLADKVGASGPLDCGKARKYTFQIGQALSYLHEQRICHYDVKPANIMLPEEDKAVLIDFGISRHYDEQGNATTARPVGYSGGFSSPEQILGDTQRFSPAADIYSLAALLYFMVTGKVPPESPESDGKHDDYPPGTPQEIRNAVRAGMNADPRKRPGTVNEWLALLDDSTRTRAGKDGSEGEGNTPPTPPNPGPPAGPATGGWRKWMIALLCLALGIAAACLFIFLNKTDNKTALKTRTSGKQIIENTKDSVATAEIVPATTTVTIPTEKPENTPTDKLESTPMDGTETTPAQKPATGIPANTTPNNNLVTHKIGKNEETSSIQRGTEGSDVGSIERSSSIKEMETKAKEGDPLALYNLGVVYYNGKFGIKPDKRKAAEFFLQSAQKGHAPAQFTIAFCLYNGEGVRQDLQAARSWMEKAAGNNHDDAKAFLETHTFE